MLVPNPLISIILIKASGGGNIFAKLFMMFLGSDIYCKLPKTTKMGHPYGIIIHSRTRLGEHCTIMQQVTIGAKYPNGGVPQIGDNVYIGAGAKLLGPITIGDDVKIGANAVVTKNISNGLTVVGCNKIL